MIDNYRVVNTPDGVKKVVDAPDYIQRFGPLEAALEKGIVYAEMNNGRFWRVRRNGATKRWKRDPARFRIPIKAGLRAYAAIDNDNVKHFYVVID